MIDFRGGGGRRKSESVETEGKKKSKTYYEVNGARESAKIGNE